MLIDKLLCLFGKHKRFYWTPEKCRQENVVSGVFTPWKCRICGHESQIFFIPPMPNKKEIKC